MRNERKKNWERKKANKRRKSSQDFCCLLQTYEEFDKLIKCLHILATYGEILSYPEHQRTADWRRICRVDRDFKETVECFEVCMCDFTLIVMFILFLAHSKNELMQWRGVRRLSVCLSYPTINLVVCCVHLARGYKGKYRLLSGKDLVC